MPPKPNWRVLLIGGASGTGKTSLAQRLSRELGVTLLLTDDIRLAIQSVTTPEQLPDLHFFLTRDDLWSQPAEVWQQGWIGVGNIMATALEQVVAHHVVVKDAGPLIIEGDCILPHSIVHTQSNLPNPEETDQVRALFLYEPDQAKLLDNLRQNKDRGFPRLPPERQIIVSHAAWIFGLWLKSEAERAGLPALASCPWETLDRRALRMIEEMQ